MLAPAESRLRRVYVIQTLDDGLFMTVDLFFCRSLKGAGRLYDREEAELTARENLNHGEPFEIHSFWEPWSDY